MEWSQLGITQSLVEGIQESFKFDSPTPVQRAVISHFSGNKDVCVESCTGSGKTLAFLIPILQKILIQNPPSPFALILSPSRELALQTFLVAQTLTEKFEGVECQCFIGGHDKANDVKELSQCKHIIVGTPGRVLDLIRTLDLAVKRIEVLVLDEADRLLDMGFKDTINEIIAALPKQRRTGLFSATMNTDVEHLVKAGLRNPVYVKVKVKKEGQELPSGLTNYFTTFKTYKEKLLGLLRFLQKYQTKKIIVFFATCASTNFYETILTELSDSSISSESLSFLSSLQFFRMHGKMKQVQREKVCEDFSSSSSGVLLSTDLVARGLDFIDIKWILQFDPPQNPDFFVHRIGRTARASKSGKSLIFLCEKEQSYLNYLELKGIQFKPKKLKLARNVFQEVSSVVLRNRENYEKAQAAFVAYVRYYKEHLLSFIFQFKDLDLGFLAQSFCLLRIPRVSEIVGKKIENFVQSELDPDDIRYSDLAREEKRQKMMREKQELKEKMFQDKKKRKMKNLKKNNQRPRSRSEKREAKRQMMIDDFDDLGKEERVVKKIRKGKMEDPEVQKFLEDNPNFKSFFRKKKH